MREIIFRGKDIYANEWVEGSLILYKKPVTARTLEDSFENHYYIVPFDMGYEVEVDPKTIGQWTGLTDKNGVKIFEGGIVKYKYVRRFDEVSDIPRLDSANVFEFTMSVKYVDGKFHPIPEINYCDDYWYANGKIDFEVIGNIHDNPELLEVK